MTLAMRNLGHNAFSADLAPCSGGHPEWHIIGNVLDVIYDRWDMVLAFPPCTHLSSSGARWWPAKQRDGRQLEAMAFFMDLMDCGCRRVAVENPVGIMNTAYRAPDQIIQPWQFGHGEVKTTCLWLKGLKPLVPTDIVGGREQKMWRMSPSADRASLRSKTYPGIAKAMAHQWAGVK